MRRLLPPAYFYLAIALMVLLRVLVPLWVLVRWPWNLIGLVPLVVGAALAVAGSRAFRQAGTTIRPFQTSAALVTSGLFSLSRNPMYLGMALGLAGIGLLLGAASPFLVLPVFVLLLDRRFIAVEERMLAETFGASYAAYRRRTRRWL
jgi:protein-S-isoprenylcysteine O-methyltransferase Ste14